MDSSTASEPASPETAPVRNAISGAIAPWWHTGLLIVFLLFASYSQANTLGGIVRQHGRSSLYVTTMAFEWGMIVYIWFGLRSRGARLPEIVGGAWGRAEDALIDGVIAVAYLFCALLVLSAVRLAVGLLSFNRAENLQKLNETSKTLGVLAPHGRVELILFILLAMTAGFCEELIFRGYFQRQFQSVTGSVAAGVVLQGILFGAAHGYQGWRWMITIAVYGMLFGILATWRRSLRPGMIAHFLQDFGSGLALWFMAQHPEFFPH